MSDANVTSRSTDQGRAECHAYGGQGEDGTVACVGSGRQEEEGVHSGRPGVVPFPSDKAVHVVETLRRPTDSEWVMYPAAMYGPHSIKGLRVGEKKLWCACGLSKRQPWCDGSHIGTGCKPLKWTVMKNQVLHQICACKYTQDPPYCDATHTNLPCDILDRQAKCSQKDSHVPQTRLCMRCGWVPDF